jgi:hypothetical protein
MEALTAAAVAALTVYDMTKALDKAIVIREIRLEQNPAAKAETLREAGSSQGIEAGCGCRVPHPGVAGVGITNAVGAPS